MLLALSTLLATTTTALPFLGERGSLLRRGRFGLREEAAGLREAADLLFLFKSGER